MAKKLSAQLAAFIEHVAELEKADEFDDDGFAKQFRELRSLGLAHKEENKFPATEGRKDENIKKNRYKDILPFDATRVTLQAKPDEPGSDYINANFITGANGEVAYIASQGPLPHTVQAFLRMLWEYAVEVVVMVCLETESGKAKCERYWPKNLSEEKQFGDIHVKLVEEVKVSMFFIMRTISVWMANEESSKRTIKHFHYTGWMDHDIPHDLGDIIDLLGRVRHHQTNHVKPVVVHCSAGCGRTGTICAIGYVWNMLRDGMITENFNLYDIILKMRSQRQSMVQTPDQYKVVHLAVKQMFENQLEQLVQHEYENVQVKDKPRITSATQPVNSMNQVTKEDSGVKVASKPVQSQKEQSVLKQKSQPTGAKSTQPAARPIKPTNIAIPKSTNVKGDSQTGKKLPTPDSKPLLSPKPVVDLESKSISSHPKQPPSEGSQKSSVSKAARPSSQQSSSCSYANVTLPEIHENAKSGQFVTKITVGPDASANVQAKTVPRSATKETHRSPLPLDNSVSPDKTKTAATATQVHKKPEVGHQKPKRVNNKVAQAVSTFSTVEKSASQQTREKPPISNKTEQKSPPSGAVQSVSVQEGEYSEITKTGTSSGNPAVSSGKTISKRAPAPLPPSSRLAGQYEDVGTGFGKDYSYAEPNATDKWPLQRMARQRQQQMPTAEYEEVALNAPLKSSNFTAPDNFGEPAYASVDDTGGPLGSPPIPVPVKTPGAYIFEDEEVEEQNGKKKRGIIDAIKNKVSGSKGEADLTKGGKGSHTTDPEIVIFNSKPIGGFGKRVRKPKGPRSVPRGWPRESSL